MAKCFNVHHGAVQYPIWIRPDKAQPKRNFQSREFVTAYERAVKRDILNREFIRLDSLRWRGEHSEVTAKRVNKERGKVLNSRKITAAYFFKRFLSGGLNDDTRKARL